MRMKKIYLFLVLVAAVLFTMTSSGATESD